MLSRVADSIFWMARYVERAENCSRLLLSTQDLLLDAGAERANESQFWQPILATTGDESVFHGLFPEITGKAVASFLTLSEENPNSILSCIRAARENARTVRDQISDELWESVNSLKIYAQNSEAASVDLAQSAAFHEQVISTSNLFQGVAASTIPRGEVWHFLRLGTCLERADKMSRLVDSCSNLALEMPPHPKARPLRWAALLRSSSAWHAFQAQSSRLDPKSIVEYLLLEPEFPRSVACSANELANTLEILCGSNPKGDLALPVRLAGRLQAELAYTTIEEVLDHGLNEYIDDLQTKLNGIGHAIFQAFVFCADFVPVEEANVTLFVQPTLGAWHRGIENIMEVQQQQQQ
ncbi:MAG: alpha-E domain-containing protein [Akkermansiaceae bacterium]|nr:alpha-E domain-containing protein [Akkermansiaceae bacterium]